MGAASVRSQKSSLEVCLSSTLARTSGTETNLSKTNNKGHLGLGKEASALKVLVTWGCPVFSTLEQIEQEDGRQGVGVRVYSQD